MAKLVIADINADYGATASINAAFDDIETAIENTLSRDGTSPNAMSAEIDMGSNAINNLGTPQNNNSAARLQDIVDSSVSLTSTSAVTTSVVDTLEYYEGTNVEAVLEEIGSVTVDDIASLRLHGKGNTARIKGYYIDGDGGEGDFYWDSTSTETDNGGTVIKVTAVTTGRWLRLCSGDIRVAWFGIPNSDDATTDRLSEFEAAILEANTRGVRVLTDYNTFALSDLELPSNNNIEIVGPTEQYRYTTIQHLNTTGKMIGLDTSIFETVHSIIFRNIKFVAHASAVSGAKGVYINRPTSGQGAFNLKTHFCAFEGWPVGYECHAAFESGHYVTSFNNCTIGHYGFEGPSNVYRNIDIRVVPANGIGVWLLGRQATVITSGGNSTGSGAGSIAFRVGNDINATGTDITAVSLPASVNFISPHMEGVAIGIECRAASRYSAYSPSVIANTLTGVIPFKFFFLTKDIIINSPEYAVVSGGTFGNHIECTSISQGDASIRYRRDQVTQIPTLSGISYLTGFSDVYETFTSIVLSANWTTFTTGAGQTLPFDTVARSTKNDHDLANNAVEIQVDGFYDVSFLAKVSNHTATTLYTVEIQVAGVSKLIKQIRATSTGSMSLDLSGIVGAVDGNDITVKLTQDSGVNVTVDNSNASTYLTITKNAN